MCMTVVLDSSTPYAMQAWTLMHASMLSVDAWQVHACAARAPLLPKHHERRV
jgi:hypothetical protein